jgi:DNA-binding NtrC family response regulator/predicted ATPase/class 3 adenylate cyclase/predicted negative regulator of RcsB-dependent stress response
MNPKGKENRIIMSNIIGTSPKILDVVRLIEKISDSSISVLITGESGTGKELAARTIHMNSPRSDKPFIAINCAALPESLLESELFGIEKGVATGVEKRLGKIETANGGTLFLDEIGDMSLSAQAKLLRVLQERKLERVGGKGAIDIDIRVLAATNKDLKKEIEKGTFREDLYYRLNVVQIHMPPLRERKEDICPLANHFLVNFEGEIGKNSMRFSTEAMDCLMKYNWPGNVRELENKVKRAAVLASGDVIEKENLSEYLRDTLENRSVSRYAPTTAEATQPLRGSVEEVEIKKIKEALEKSGGNKQKASRILGITRQGLIYKMKRYGLFSGAKSEIRRSTDSVQKCQTHEKAPPDGGVNPSKASVLDETQSPIPKHLAEKILRSKTSLEGERKQVTALFAGICGFAELSERVDPEEVRTLMNRCFKIIIDQVYRYEGTINQFTGDGVMALFGAPIALEDHPYKAVSAALAIQREIKIYGDKLKKESNIDFRIRIGLNTGLVVVGNIGNDLGMDYTAIGDTINLASYLLNVADPGRVLISENTNKLVSGYFLTRPLEKVRAKGKSESIKVYEVIRTRGTRTRIDIQVERGLTPFTGREKELGVLKDCLSETKEGRGQIVFIVGEPGVGKSRLLLEFRKSLSVENISWLEGRCTSFGRSIAYLPLIEILKRNFQVADKSDNEQEIVRKIEEGTLLLGSDLEPTIPYFKYLLSVDPRETPVSTMDAQQRRAEIFEALRKVILRGSQIRLLVLLIEDLHWIDKASEEFLLYIADSIAAAPVLLLLTYRPGYSQPLGERTYHTRIQLRNLTREESVRMAEGILETSGLPDEIRDLINKKAEGNPFFIEELLKSLRECGVIVKTETGYAINNKNAAQMEVPGTIQDIIMARIDRLDENLKRTLQVGSVIGREFSFNLLQRVSSLSDQELRDHLLALRNTELIYERGFSLDANYIFKHALTHEVAYGDLLIQKRKEIHERVGNAIEDMYPNRIEEFCEVLAHHFSRANNGEKASHYLTMAGKKAKEIFATEEAFRFFNEALRYLDGMPNTKMNEERKIDILFDMENIYDAIGKREEQKRVLEAIIDLSKSINDERRLSDGYIRRAEFLSVLEEYQEAEAIGRSALTLKRKVGDKAGEGKALRGMGFIHWRLGDYNKALKYHQEALDVHRRLGGGEAEAFELINLGEVYRQLGQYEDALLHLQEALRIYRQLRITNGQNIAEFNIGNVYRDMGKFHACLEHYQESWRIIKESGLSSLNSYSHLTVPTTIANVFWRLGNYQQSLRYYSEALNISRGLRDRFEEANILSYIAAIYGILGDYQESINHYEEALKIYREIGNKVSEGRVLSLMGNIYRQNLHDYTKALPSYKKSLEIKKEIGNEDEIRILLNSLGVVCWNLGLYVEALSYYQDALQICKKTGNIVGEGVALSGMGVVYLSLRKYEEALECNQKSLNILKAIGDQRAEGYILNSTGNMYYEMGDYQMAWKYYQESLKIRKEIQDKKGEAWVLYNLGRVYQNLENYKESKKHLEEALSLAVGLGEEELKTSIKKTLQ